MFIEQVNSVVSSFWTYLSCWLCRTVTTKCKELITKIDVSEIHWQTQDLMSLEQSIKCASYVVFLSEWFNLLLFTFGQAGLTHKTSFNKNVSVYNATYVMGYSIKIKICMQNFKIIMSILFQRWNLSRVHTTFSYGRFSGIDVQKPRKGRFKWYDISSMRIIKK